MSKTREYVCHCGKTFTAKVADRRRGWARSCSKSCAAWKREKKLNRYGNGLPYHAQPGSQGLTATAHLFSNEEHDCNKE